MSSANLSILAALFAVDPIGLGGVALRAPACSARDEWLAGLRQLLPQSTPVRRIPLNINDAGLLGGLDLGATLQAGRPVAQRGILNQADGGVVVLAMAERLSSATAARLAAVLDSGEVVVERDGFATRSTARLGMIALDEGASDDEQVPAALLDRLAFHVQLSSQPETPDTFSWDAQDIAQAKARLPTVNAHQEVMEALCGAALALGIDSMRAPLLALRVARIAAALSGQIDVTEEHVSLAARLVLAPRARQLPAPPATAQNEESDEQNGDDKQHEANENSRKEPEPKPEPEHAEEESAGSSLAEMVVEAAKASIPAGLLAALKIGEMAKTQAQAVGRAGASQKSPTRGRPIGARRGEPRSGSRINVIETLRAAAPWQKLRKLEAAASVKPLGQSVQRIHVRKQDFHVTRFKQVGQTTTLFVVDASGSSALNRLAEAKGAVELLLADCYVRRDRVAVLAFKGKSAELLLPPTRSLARAKRSLAGLPGGGGTPLATAIDAAGELADQIKRRGETPIIVLLTDGRGNIARDGTPGRVQASEDALAAARQIRFSRLTSLLLDTSPQPHAAAQLIARELGATYVPLPYAGAQKVAQLVRALVASP